MAAHEMPEDLDEHEQEEVRERSSPPGKIVYEAVMKEAGAELGRSTSALFWSGLAAGLSMGFSPWGDAFGGFVVPALIGNIMGGVLLVAALNHAQVVAGDDRERQENLSQHRSGRIGNELK